jgi:hypothetical protein
MKTVLIFLTLGALMFRVPPAAAQGAAAVTVKQRAKEVVNQSNVRQGVNTPAAPVASPADGTSPAAQVAAAAVQAAVSQVAGALTQLKGPGAVTGEKKAALVRALQAAARGPQKPAETQLNDVVEALAGCLPGTVLEETELRRLATDLYALVNSATLSADRTRQILEDVQAILQVGGVRRAQALDVVRRLERVTQSLQQPVTP